MNEICARKNNTQSNARIIPERFLFFAPSISRAMNTSIPMAPTSSTSDSIVPKPPIRDFSYKSSLVNELLDFSRNVCNIP